MQDLWQRIHSKIRRIDFDTLWPGFRPFPFAFYDDKRVVFSDRTLPWDARFLGNTAIDWEGSPLAIWKIESPEPADEDVLTSKLVHEMFHAFQKASGETRWADEIRQGLRYQYHPDNLCLKFMEDFHLCGFLTSFSVETWQILLSVRNGRAQRFPEEVDYEARIETIEGMAEYIELQALRVLDERKYQQSLQRIVETLNDPAKLFPIRSVCYHSGAVMCVLADRHGLAIWHEIGKESRTIDRLLADGLPARIRPVKIQSVITEVDRFLAQRKETMDHFFCGAEPYLEGNFPLIGMDPMNTFVLDQRIYFRNFIGYMDTDGPKVFMGEGAGDFDADFNLRRIFRKRGI